MKYLRKLKISLVKSEYKNPIKGQVRNPKQIYEIFRKIKDAAQETLIGVYLTEKLEVNAYDIISLGTENETLAPPEEVFNRAIITRSKVFLLIHNHPSGNPQPSREDRELIETLKIYAKDLKRTFLDFIIVGDNCYWSMFEEENESKYTIAIN